MSLVSESSEGKEKKAKMMLLKDKKKMWVQRKPSIETEKEAIPQRNTQLMTKVKAKVRPRRAVISRDDTSLNTSNNMVTETNRSLESIQEDEEFDPAPLILDDK